MIHHFPGLTNGLSYYLKLYTINPQGRINNRADLPVLMAVPSVFPRQPASEDEYTLITEITSTQTYTAPEDGWFLIEVHGASGSGGDSGLSSVSWYTTEDEEGERMFGFKTGGSGAGSSYGASIVKLRKGDPLHITVGGTGNTTAVAITSTAGESYETITVTSGGKGTNASTSSVGSAGLAGDASGGNLYNLKGSSGKFGTSGFFYDRDDVTVSYREGGAPAHKDGSFGGSSSYITNGIRYAASSGKAGYIRVSRGRTNVVNV